MPFHPRYFQRCELGQSVSGMALTEFALTLPILSLMLVGTIEVARYAILNQKLDKAANAMADFVTQSSGAVRNQDLDSYARALPEILKPYSFDGSVIFNSVASYNTLTPPCPVAKQPCIAWQYSVGNAQSQIGQVGGSANIPGNYTVLPNQSAVVAEIFYNYKPLLNMTGSIIPILGDHVIYKTAVYKPRYPIAAPPDAAPDAPPPDAPPLDSPPPDAPTPDTPAPDAPPLDSPPPDAPPADAPPADAPPADAPPPDAPPPDAPPADAPPPDGPAPDAPPADAPPADAPPSDTPAPDTPAPGPAPAPAPHPGPPK